MTDRGLPVSHLNLAEETIIRSFGWAIIEFEATLYQKFLLMSADSSLVTEEQFKKHLLQMEARGLVASLDFQGKRVWKKLIVEEDFELTLQPTQEVRKSIQQKSRILKEKRRVKVKEHLVTDSKIIGQDILEELEDRLLRGREATPKDREMIHSHIENMRRKLCASEDAFLDYVRENLPGISESVEQILRSRGLEFLLLSLRLIETG